MTATIQETSGLRRLTAQDRRRFRRVILSTNARCMWSRGVEFRATTVDLCAGGLSLKTDQPYELGEELIIYVEDLGRLVGTVARSTAFGFAVTFQLVPKKREKIADILTWMIDKNALNLDDERNSKRRTFGGSLLVTFENGVVSQCDVVDLSLTGVGLKTSGVKPPIGAVVKIGSRLGRCSRYIDNGFAVEFT